MSLKYLQLVIISAFSFYPLDEETERGVAGERATPLPDLTDMCYRSFTASQSDTILISPGKHTRNWYVPGDVAGRNPI